MMSAGEEGASTCACYNVDELIKSHQNVEATQYFTVIEAISLLVDV